jgi:hypothetical protein
MCYNSPLTSTPASLQAVWHALPQTLSAVLHDKHVVVLSDKLSLMPLLII